jgi:Ca2+-binding EF-hand superfamily protein
MAYPGQMEDYPYDSAKGKAERARNPAVLLKVVSEEFRLYDKYQRGIISSSSFARVFSDLNIDYASAEAEEIMRYVTVTNDGFVHYKALMQHVAPKHTAAGTTIEHSISPQVEAGLEVEPLRFDKNNVALMTPTERRQFIIDRTEAIRKIYTEWDRGSIDNTAFKNRITEIGIPISDELHRIIDMHDNSRALSFSKVIQALQIGDYMLHKSRDPEALTNWTPQPRLHRANIAPRNPVSWQDVDAPAGQAIDDGSLRHYINQAQDGDPLAELKAVICAYMVGSIPTVEFVAHLDRHDIPMTQELQRLLRQQQCDNRGTFRDYVKAIFPHRTDVGDSDQPGMIAYLSGVQQGPPDEDEPRRAQLGRELTAYGKEVEEYVPHEQRGHFEMREAMEDDMTFAHVPHEFDVSATKYLDESQPFSGVEPEGPSAVPLPPKKQHVLKKRLYGGYGDIISWAGGGQDEPVTQPKGTVHRDFVGNPSIISHQDDADQPPPTRPATGQRFNPQTARPVPFGTDADVGIRPQPIQPSSGGGRRGYRGDRW